MLVAEALPAVSAVLVLLLATVLVFASRVVLVGRPSDAPTTGRWTLAGFFRAWWRWVRRVDRSRSRPLARVIPLDAARRARAAR